MKKKENLRQRAYLNTVTSYIDFGSKQVVGFFLNPIKVAILGPTFYGVWKIISQLNSYMATTDLQASQPLKWIIAQERTVKPEHELRKSLTAALYATLLFLPLYLIAGTVIVWISPIVSNVEEDYYAIVRSATAFLVISFILGQYFEMFGSVLRGMNLGYKRIGLRAIISIIGGALTAGTLYMGYGLVGIAAIQVIVTILAGVTLLWIVKKNVNWIGLARVRLQEVLRFIKFSGWFMLWKITKIADTSTDIILLGILAGPKTVAVYSITRFLMNTASGLVNRTLPAITPGLGRLFGERDFKKLLNVRSQVLMFTWLMGTATGTVICIWNESFITTWVGNEFFSGQPETFLIVIIGFLSLIKQVDESIIKVTIDLRHMIFLTGIVAAITIVLALLLIPIYETTGLLIALLTGQIINMIGYPLILQKMLNVQGLLKTVFLKRYVIVCITLLTAAGFAGFSFNVTGWLNLIAVVSITFLAASLLLWGFALSATDRELVKSNFQNVKFFKTND